MIENIKRVKEELEFNPLDIGIVFSSRREISPSGTSNKCEVEPTKMMDVYKCYLFSEIDEEELVKLQKIKSKTSSFLQTKDYITNRVIFCGGKGGSGKTYDTLNNKSIDYNYFSYSSFTNNLITQKYMECIDDKKDIVPATIYKLLGEYNKQKIDKITRKVKFIELDEATLLCTTLIEKVIKEYPDCYIFILGDITPDGTFYQCTTLQSKNMFVPSTHNLQYVKYTKTHRFGENFNDDLNEIRSKMDEYRKYGSNAIKVLYSWFVKKWSDRIFDVKDIKIKQNDVCISCKNDLGEHSSKLLEYFTKKGVKSKFYTKNTDLKMNRMAWQELDGKPEHKNYVETIFRTIHSYQGLQLDHKQNLIICLDSLFDYNLIYTALSRARRRDQIYIFLNL
jgi:hypothetical protein